MEENKKVDSVGSEARDASSDTVREAVRPQILRVKTGIKAGPNRRK